MYGGLKRQGFGVYHLNLKSRGFFFYLTLMYSQNKIVFHLVHAHKMLSLFSSDLIIVH